MFLGKTIFYLFLFIKCMSLKPKVENCLNVHLKNVFSLIFIVQRERIAGSDIEWPLQGSMIH